MEGNRHKPTCTLCSTELASKSQGIWDGELFFCCAGCHAVFTVLSTKNQLIHYENSPIFQQALRYGLISNPALLEQIQKQRPNLPEHEWNKWHLEIGEMWCPACAEVIRLLLLQEKGIKQCIIDYSTDFASIEFAPRYISKDRICTLISSLGYQPLDLTSSRNGVSKALYLRATVAAFFALNAMMFTSPLYATYFHEDPQNYGTLFAWLSGMVSVPVITYSGWPIFRRFWNSLRLGFYGMETLVVIGVMAAFGLSWIELSQGGTRVYFDSMTIIILFMLIGKIIESKAKFSAKDSIMHLIQALPKRGRKRQKDGSYIFIPMKEVVLGDVLVAFSGEKVVLDGLVLEGSGVCDESLMTGESVPVQKTVGSPLLGGSILQSGQLTFQVTTPPEHSALQKMIEIVHEEIRHKTKYVRAADRIVQWFVPLVLAVAACTVLGYWAFAFYDLQTAFLRAISVLLISCPCAIGIAAPLAESYVLNRLAQMGVIIRNRGCLSVLGQETVFVFDKTGTVTEGKFIVLQGLEALSLEQRSLLKGLSSQSSHLIATAISQAIDDPSTPIREVEEFVGLGLKGVWRTKCYFLGSAAFLSQQGIQPCSTEVSKDDLVHTLVYFACENRCLAALVLGDRIRTGMHGLLTALKQEQKILLSGDSEEAVSTVAKKCGFDQWKSNYHPSHKRDYVADLRAQGHIVCMIGDGINDAPALSAAQIGISVISASDISIHVSDVLLTTSQLQVILKMRALAIKARKIVKQNLFWAFFYNIIGMILAISGVLSPLFAAFAMVSSSLIVLFNAKRL